MRLGVLFDLLIEVTKKPRCEGVAHRQHYPGYQQEPITRSLHLPYKPLESTLSDEKLFIEIVLAQNLSW